MSKLVHSAAAIALTLAASLLSSAAHAAQQGAAASQPQITLTQPAPADPAVQQPQGLTRKQVYDQLIREEKDGSLARLNATVYKGS
jgi:hypothetical protein